MGSGIDRAAPEPEGRAPDEGAPPNVLHVIDSLRSGGAEALLTALVGELAGRGLSRNIVVVAATDADALLLTRLRQAAHEVTLLPARSIHDRHLLGTLVRTVRAQQIDVVHSHLSTANVSSRFAARLTGRPHVTTIDTPPGPAAEDTRAHAALDGWSSHLSARLVCPSAEISAAVRRRYRVPSRRLLVIANAPVTAVPGPGYDRAAMRFALLDGMAGPLVACVARLQAEKGVDDLISAARRAADSLPGLRVVVAGAGPEDERLRLAARSSGDIVRLLGPRPDVGAVLAAADAFCLPSHHEGMPISMLEAMQAGLPCVVTAVGGIPDVVTDEETGLLVQPRAPGRLAEALERVLTDRALATRLGTAAQRLTRDRYSLASLANRYAALYRELSGA